MTTLQIAEDALKECQRLLKAADDYEWLYCDNDYPVSQRVSRRIADALDAIIEVKDRGDSDLGDSGLYVRIRRRRWEKSEKNGGDQ